MKQRWIHALPLLGCLLVGCAAATRPDLGSASSAAPASRAASADNVPASHTPCVVTPYSPARPPDAHTAAFSSTWYGNSDLWAGLAPPYEGEWYAGNQGLKVLWYRVQPGEPLSVTGKRLDAPAPPLQANIPDGYDGHMQSSGIVFPTEGCWEVTGTVTDKHLQFTVLVRPASEHPIK